MRPSTGSQIDENEQGALGPPDTNDVVSELAAEHGGGGFDLGLGQPVDLQHLVDVEAQHLALGAVDQKDAPLLVSSPPETGAAGADR